MSAGDKSLIFGRVDGGYEVETVAARDDEIQAAVIQRKLDLVIGLLRFAIWCKEQRRARDIRERDIYRRMVAALQKGRSS